MLLKPFNIQHLEVKFLVLVLTFHFSLLTFNSSSQGVSINTTSSSADASAILDISSSSQGLLIPRMTTAQRDNISSPATSLLIFNVTTDCFESYVNGTWFSVSCPLPASFVCGDNWVVTHTAGSIAPISKTVNYGTVLTNITGADKCWITQNLGADHQASAATDASEASSGWYWQFDQLQGFDIANDNFTRTPNTAWITSISENSDWLPANDPCTALLGAGWRIPTTTEWTTANANGAGSGIPWNGYNGTHSDFASPLYLHGAGFLYYLTGGLMNRGKNGYYWSSFSYAAPMNAHHLYFDSSSSSGSDFYSANKATAFPVRCLNP
jgi:uncharacterized protein (TIGR02145 family)